MDAAEVERRLRAILPHLPLRLVMVFGSVGRGTATEQSDVDLAVLPTGALTLADEMAMQGRMEAALGAAVDLVRLDLADPVLRWPVARDGVVVHSRSPSDASRFVAYAAIEHDEMAHVMADASRRFTSRLARRSE